MEFITEYISAIGWVAAFGVGFIIKNLVPNENVNKFIPFIAAIVGIFICLWDAGWVATPQVVVTGMISGLAATGLDQAIKKFMEVTEPFQHSD